MKMIFFNIAWMESYQGATASDQPKDGGTWEVKHEVCNFANIDGRCYGFVYQTNFGAINLDRIGASSDEDRIDNVTVVWTAKRQGKGTVVVGFYRNATVYRNIQSIPKSSLHAENQINQFYAECAAQDAILLSPIKRTFPVPRGESAMGQHAIWYADTEVGETVKLELSKYAAQLFEAKASDLAAENLIGNAFSSIGEFDPNLKVLQEDIDQIENGDGLPSEKATLIKARLGQGKFRQNVDAIWSNVCAVTGCAVRDVLRASHIKPWRECTNIKERLDPDNGLLLAAHLDALFDKGLISFSNEGVMLVAQQIAPVECDRLGLTGKLRKPLTNGQKRYLADHRNRFGI